MYKAFVHNHINALYVILMRVFSLPIRKLFNELIIKISKVACGFSSTTTAFGQNLRFVYCIAVVILINQLYNEHAYCRRETAHIDHTDVRKLVDGLHLSLVSTLFCSH
jgi:hypothetical protein